MLTVEFEKEKPQTIAGRGFCRKLVSTKTLFTMSNLHNPTPRRKRTLEELIASRKEFHLRKQKAKPTTEKAFILSKIRKIRKTKCWEWQGSLNARGYGKAYFNKRLYTAHGLSYSVFVGDFDKALYVCHKCDNPKCVNPEHLFLGTAKENMDDCFKKGRHTNVFKPGHTPKNSKLDKETATKIILYLMDHPEQKLSKVSEKFKVPLSTIKDIKRGRSYSNLIVFVPEIS